MNLKILLKNIGEMGKSQKLINFSAAGTSLDQINGMEVKWYPMLFSSPTGTHTVAQNITTFDITLYYIDRLLTDYSNDIDIFSSAIENLKNIINGIKSLPGVVDVVDNYTIRNFTNTEKMNDSLAGAYAQVRIMVINDTVCFFEEEEPPIDYTKEYLTISPLEDGSIIAKQSMEVSIDGGKTWKSVDANDVIQLRVGKDLKFRGELIKKYKCFAHGDELTKYTVYGNIASLQYGEEFSGQTAMLGYLKQLFLGTGVVDASNLYIPDPGFPEQYTSMFSGCVNLAKAPSLPATTLVGKACYSYMFYGCTSLTAAPELPATTLTENCYEGMFHNCTSLTTAPELPATTLTKKSYMQMFSNCTSLVKAPELPSTTLAEDCYNTMFSDCANLIYAPELPATTLPNGCYGQMFLRCANLNHIKCLATDITADRCTYKWVSGVAATGTFVKNPAMNAWTSGDYGIPVNWVVENE